MALAPGEAGVLMRCCEP
ncbi:hypothetical protein HaLaN_20660, partial [Haematococcus lacustris]